MCEQANSTKSRFTHRKAQNKKGIIAPPVSRGLSRFS